MWHGRSSASVQVSTVAATCLVTTQINVFSFARNNFMFIIGSSINLSRKSFKTKSQNIIGNELFTFIIWQCNSDIFLSANSGKRY